MTTANRIAGLAFGKYVVTAVQAEGEREAEAGQ